MKKIKMTYERINNLCHDLLEEVAGQPLPWYIEANREVRDTVIEVLHDVHGIWIRENNE